MKAKMFGVSIMQIKRGQGFRFYLTAILLSFEIMLSFSSFGYVSMGNWTLSFVPIGVYAMSVLVDAKRAVLAGLVFGLSSMWMADIGFGRELDYLYSPLLSGYPAASIVLAIGTRLFMGLVAGIALQKARKHARHRCLALAAATTVTQILYTAVSVAAGVVLFPELDTAAMDIGSHALSLLSNLVTECIVFSAVVMVLCKVTAMKKVRAIADHCRAGMEKIPAGWAIGGIFGMTLFFSVFSIGTVLHDLTMSTRTLEAAGFPLSHDTMSTLLKVELQQMCSNLALFEFVILLVVLLCFYFIERRDALRYRADRDMMTGLYNRETAKERIQSYQNSHKGSPCTFVIVDIDGLKRINDTLGHAAGDVAITGVANVLRSEFRQSDIVARLGGDEFIVFIGGSASTEALAPYLESVQNGISEVRFVGSTRKLHVSIGVRFDLTGTLSMDDLYRDADEALYRSKAGGKNTVTYFED